MRTTQRQSTGLRQPAVLAWLRLARVFQKVDAASNRLCEEYDLNSAQFDVLAHIGAAEGITQQELADSLLVTKGNISQLLAKLEQRGVIVRRHEGRTNCLFLTDQGRALYDAVVPRQEARIADLFASLAGEEQVQLWRLMRKLDRELAK